ncbi:hypothetical protein PBRA_008869 [Plasmodiophora brassicae]|uniref:Uncharacterized protein n=1 Tax=Plasmodiophora brassicae TaxID=37360 RepID=A0A0G4J402_PLABS|nr:hypothetical protein PBRA_008869 [Plasmodiophora brassicae]
MGGNAFPETSRLTRAEFLRVSSAVRAALENAGLVVRQPPEVSDKADFGDVDFYVSADSAEVLRNLLPAMKSAVVEAVGGDVQHAGIVRCGRTVSFLTKERYQVDVALIHDPDLLPLVTSVKSNGDFVWLLQKSLSVYNLLLSDKGLFLVDSTVAVRLSGEMNELDDGVSNIQLSKKDGSFLLSIDPVMIAEFVGLPPRAFDGCTPLSSIEMFDIVHRARYFHPKALQSWSEQKSSDMRRRMRRRPLIVQYIQYVSQEATHPPYDAYGIEQVKQMALNHFDKQDSYARHLSLIRQRAMDDRARQLCKPYINGPLLQQWIPGLKGADVGRVLQATREAHGPDWPRFHAWLRAQTADAIRQAAVEIAYKTVDQ